MEQKFALRKLGLKLYQTELRGITKGTSQTSAEAQELTASRLDKADKDFLTSPLDITAAS